MKHANYSCVYNCFFLKENMLTVSFLLIFIISLSIPIPVCLLIHGAYNNFLFEWMVFRIWFRLSVEYCGLSCTGKIVQSTLEECREAYGLWIQMVSPFPLQIWQVLIKVKVLSDEIFSGKGIIEAETYRFWRFECYIILPFF